jgi:CrcB protein
VTTLTWILAALACGLGATVRYGIAHLDPEPRFPWTTVTSNALGSAVLGAIAAALDAGASASVALIVGAGFAGGLTTFSTLAVDAVVLLNERRAAAFWWYLWGTLIVGVLAAFAGFAVWSAVAA